MFGLRLVGAALVAVTLSTSAVWAGQTGGARLNQPPKKLVKSDAEWKRLLSPEEYRVLREKGTERAHSGKYWNHHERGAYHCAACGLELFSWKHKFESGTGWPSFWQPARQSVIETEVDRSLFMVRIAVNCARCGGHLGHVFEDGPRPTGLRYCINSVALKFKKAPKAQY